MAEKFTLDKRTFKIMVFYGKKDSDNPKLNFYNIINKTKPKIKPKQTKKTKAKPKLYRSS